MATGPAKDPFSLGDYWNGAMDMADDLKWQAIRATDPYLLPEGCNHSRMFGGKVVCKSDVSDEPLCPRYDEAQGSYVDSKGNPMSYDPSGNPFCHQY